MGGILLCHPKSEGKLAGIVRCHRHVTDFISTPGRLSKACTVVYHVQKLQEITAQAKALCQDLTQDVRLAMCEAALVPLTRTLGPATATASLLKEVLELIEVCLMM